MRKAERVESDYWRETGQRAHVDVTVAAKKLGSTTNGRHCGIVIGIQGRSRRNCESQSQLGMHVSVPVGGLKLRC
jgi:hypothetical protein